MYHLTDFLVCISIALWNNVCGAREFSVNFITPSVNFSWNWAYFQKHPAKSRIFLRELGWSLPIACLPSWDYNRLHYVNSIHEYAAYCYYTDWVVWRSVYLSTVYTVSLPWSCALQNTWIEMSFGLQCRGLLAQLSLLNSAHGAKAAYVDMACWPLLPWHFVNSSSRLWITQSLWLWRMTSGRRQSAQTHGYLPSSRFITSWPSHHTVNEMSVSQLSYI